MPIYRAIPKNISESTCGKSNYGRATGVKVHICEHHLRKDIRHEPDIGARVEALKKMTCGERGVGCILSMLIGHRGVASQFLLVSPGPILSVL